MTEFELPEIGFTHVANAVSARIISYDGSNSLVRTKFEKAIPRFLGSLGAVHGASFPIHHLNAVLEVMDHKIMNAELLQIRLKPNGPILDAALATGAPDFGVEWDINNKLKIYPVYHGEDLCVDKKIATLFRDYTKSLLHPNGFGLGTWFMREQIQRSISDSDWVFVGRDNEHFFKNEAIRGLMDKFGAIHGNENDSAVIQICGLTPAMESRFGVNDVFKEDLPADALGITKCPNNFLVRLGKDGDPQQIAITFRRLASTFDAEPVVWAKIKSNGNMPDNQTLKEVLFSLLSMGIDEIQSPERRWGVPISRLKDADDFSRYFGGPMPTMHIHANKEEQIIRALLEMDAKHRIFGHEKMVSGTIDLRKIRNTISVINCNLPEPTEVQGIVDQPVNMPYFDFLSVPMDYVTKLSNPERPDRAQKSDNDNRSLCLEAA